MDILSKNLIGAGGSNDIVEQDNNLESIGQAQILDLICGGEILGVFHSGTPLRDIYLDNTSILDDYGNYNYAGVSGIITLGKSDQNFYNESYNYFNESFATSVEYTKNTEIFNEYTDGVTADVAIGLITNRLQINLSIPSLYKQEDDGDITRNYVGFKIQVKSLLSTSDPKYYEASYIQILYGKNTSEYVYPVTFNIPDDYISDGGWQVTIWKTSEDSTSSKYHSDIYFKNVVAYSDDKFKYPNSALAAIYASAKYFDHVPGRVYDLMLKKVKVPSNYTPNEYYRDRSDQLDGYLKTEASYSGDWDGTFKEEKEWTNNPAWVFYDLLTDKIDGLGNKIEEEQIDALKWELYQISQYCDIVVTGRWITGLYGTDIETNYANEYYETKEPLYTCNAYIQTQKEAYSLLVDFASSFQSILYYGLGGLHICQDAYIDSESPSLNQFTNANVKDGEFAYFGSSLSSIYTVALVTWCDDEDNGKNKIEYVEDPEGIMQYGIRPHEINARFCTSKTQARRWGERFLWINKNETELCSFSVGLEGYTQRIGDVVDVLDNNRAGKKRGGRILSVDKSNVILGEGGIIEITLDRIIEIKKDTVSSYQPNFQFGIARNFTGSEPGYIDRASQIYDYTLLSNWWDINGFTYEGEVKRLQTLKFAVDSSYTEEENQENFWGHQLRPSIIWIFSNQELVSSKWKIINITQSEENNEEFVITCSPYNEEKYLIDGQRIQYITQTTNRLSDSYVLYTPIITSFSRRTTYSEQSNSYVSTDYLDLNWKFENNAALDPSLYSFRIYLYKDGSLYKTIGADEVGNSFNYSILFTDKGCLYTVMVEAVFTWTNATRQSTTWGYSVSAASQDELPSVNGLYLVNNILNTENAQLYDSDDSTTFYGLNAQFNWNITNQNVVYELGESTTAGVDTILKEASFKTYNIRIYDPDNLDDTQYVAEYFSPEAPWTYTFENNKKDGLRRKFVAQIAFENTDSVLGVADSIEVYNKPPRKFSASDIKCDYSKLSFSISLSTNIDYDYLGSILILTPANSENNLSSLYETYGSNSEEFLNQLSIFAKNNPNNVFVFASSLSISPLSLPQNDSSNWISNYQYIVIPFDRFAVGNSNTIDNISVSDINFSELNYSNVFYVSSNTSVSTNYFVDGESISQSMLVKSLKKQIDLISADETVVNSVNYRINQTSGVLTSENQSIKYQYQNQIELQKANGFVFREPIKAAYDKYIDSFYLGLWGGNDLTIVPNQTLEDIYNISKDAANSYPISKKRIGPTNPLLWTGVVYDLNLKSYTTGVNKYYLQYGDLWVDTTTPKYIDSEEKNNYTRTYKWTGNFSTNFDWENADKNICYWSLVQDMETEVVNVALQEEKILRNYYDGLLGGEYSVKIETTDNGQNYIAGFGLSNYKISDSTKLAYKKYLETIYLKTQSKYASDNIILNNAPHEGFYNNLEYYSYSENDSGLSENIKGRNICYKNTTRSGSWFESQNETELWYISDIERTKELYLTNSGEGFRQIGEYDLYIKEEVENTKYILKGSALDPLTGVYRNIWSEVNGSEFIVSADRFMILNPLTTGDVLNPVFYVDTAEDKVYMHNAYIKSLEADKIEAGYLKAGLVVMDSLDGSNIIRNSSDITWEDIVSYISVNGSYTIKNSQIIWVKNEFFNDNEIDTINGYEGYQYIGEEDLVITNENINSYNPVYLLYKIKDINFDYSAEAAISRLLDIWKPFTSEIRSNNYRKDAENGFIIRSDGYCEFNNIKINAEGTFKGEVNTQKADILANNFNVLASDDVFNLGYSLKIYLDSNFLNRGKESELPYNYYDSSYSDSISGSHSFEGLIRSRNLAWNYTHRAKLYLDNENIPVLENENVDGHDQNNEVLNIQHGRLWIGKEKYSDAAQDSFAINENGIMLCNQVNSEFKGKFYLNNTLDNIIFPNGKNWGDILGITKYEKIISCSSLYNGYEVPFDSSIQNKNPIMVQMTLRNTGSSFSYKILGKTFSFLKDMEIPVNSLGKWKTSNNDDQNITWSYLFSKNKFQIFFRSDEMWWAAGDSNDLINNKSNLSLVIRALFIDFNY